MWPLILLFAGIDDLLQTVLWVAEEKALMANPTKLAAGTVIEAHLDKKRGPVATLLVQVRAGNAVMMLRASRALCGKPSAIPGGAAHVHNSPYSFATYSATDAQTDRVASTVAGLVCTICVVCRLVR